MTSLARIPGSPLPLLVALALAMAARHTTAQAPTERIETFADGRVRERCGLDADGRPHGLFERFREDGSRVVRGVFRAGLRHGQWSEFDERNRRTQVAEYRDDHLDGRRETFHQNGRRAELSSWRRGMQHGSFEEHDADHDRTRTGAYRDGILHGDLKISQGRKVVTRQQWLDGELALLDGWRPFPIRQAELKDTLAQILAEPADPHLDASDAQAASRAAALRRLQAYRFLCRVPYEGMTLVPEWNALCDAAAEACRRNRKLSHSPAMPEGMDPTRYEMARTGAGRSNLATVGMVQSVDMYMDDSDPSNIDRIGHRRWCLNPAMRKTAFGADGGYSAMWSMDASGSAPSGLDTVLYPPAGWVPVGYFGARHAWSIAPVRGSGLKDIAVTKVTVRRLDGDWLPTDEPLALDHLGMAGGGYGTGQCLVFRPVGVRNVAGERFLVEVSTDSGKTVALRYVVAFCE